MTFQVRLSPNARRDRDRIIAYYDDPDRLQGDRFIDDFFQSAAQLIHQPHLGRVVRNDVRRWHLRIFPCQIWYRIDPDLKAVRIIAVVGDSQDHEQFNERR